MNKRRLGPSFACICLSVLLGGCVAFDGYPQRATDPAADLADLRPRIDANAITACLDQPTLACRNRVIAARMFATDLQFSAFEESLFGDTRKGSFTATLATLGLTTAAAASSGGGSQVLSGIAAFIIGGREAFQKEVLNERTIIAVHTAMRAKRAQVALRIRTGLGRSIAQYPMELGLADISEYYSAGTVLGALVDITENVGAAAQKAEAELQEQISFHPDAAAQKFERAVCGGEPDCPHPNPAAITRMRACWPAIGVPSDTKVLDFVLQDSFAIQRALAAECMGL